ncbi:MAG: insulinase family protein [Elusimicrobia bacterium]|nr:insulinase family protein [Elusimicrobiota bacterium]
MRRLSLFAVFLFISAVSFAAAPAPKDPIAAFPDRVHKITLSNGMRALVVERPESATVSFVMFIRTGAIDDPMGESGIAHMFEHMLFKGTKTVGTKDYAKEEPYLDKLDQAAAALQAELDKGDRADPKKLAALKEAFESLEREHATYVNEEEFWKIYERAGGQDMNAATGYDYTNYIVSLPVKHMNLWFAMEADRIAHPVLREFYKERSVVMEERRQRQDISPDGKLWENFLATAFMAHPYGRPIVGWESDISRIRRPDAERFFKAHYDVSRLVFGIVGGVKTEEVRAMLEKNFAGLQSAPSTETFRLPVEPPQEGERRVNVEFDAEPELLIGYHRPDMRHPDHAALSVLESVLSSGRTARLERNIVEKKQIAVSAFASAADPGERDACLFVLGGTPRAPHTTAELEKAIYEEVEKMKASGPTPEELARVKTNLEADVIRQMQSNSGLAGELAYYEAVAGDWHYLIDLIESIRSVTAADVTRVARTYLTPENRTVAVLVKKSPVEGGKK